ncbi:hypothetical protein VPNG_03107 [Cytospora leucostoma]|uniref:Rhodopsin domain-containing protein n=1 Tax=Cytospora leucostoma TaxID=1230097 RepID=A0A423XG97_9PEZI|nr:hypothetical protein VPNG_03107 [Cytospora leucostoma]
MGFQTILHNVSEGPITVLLIITIPLCIAATILRFVASRRAGRTVGWEDTFAALALMAFLVYSGLALAGFAITGGKATADFSLDEAVKTSKMAYAAAPFFEINQLFAKASLFVLYYRIFSSDRAFAGWIWFLVIIQVCWFIATFFALIFMCVPVSKWWDILGTEDGWCLNDAALLAAEETINSCVDFAMVGLAIAMVRKLKMKAHVKRKLAIVFAIGGLSGILGFVKIGEVYAVPDEDGETNVTNGFWDLLQMATTIFCCCAPIYKTILPPEGFWTRFKASIISFSRTSRLNKSTEGSQKFSNSSQGPFQPSSNWPRFHGGTQRDYTWAEVSTVDELPLGNLYQDHPNQVTKTVQIQQTDEMV